MNSTPLATPNRPSFFRFLSVCAQPRSLEERRNLARSRRLVSAALVIFIAFSQLVASMKVGPLRTTVAVFAGLAFCAVIYLSGELVWRTSDEFRRLLLAKSFFAASVLTFLFASLWGFAELFSRGAVAHLPLLLLPVLLVLLTTTAKLVIFRQHRAPLD